MAPRSKLTDDTRDTLARVIGAGGTYALAATVAGISERTLYAWLERGDPARRRARDAPHRDLRAAIDRARAQRESDLVLQMTRAAQRGSWRAAAWLLERRHPERWATPSQRDAIRVGTDEWG